MAYVEVSQRYGRLKAAEQNAKMLELFSHHVRIYCPSYFLFVCVNVFFIIMNLLTVLGQVELLLDNGHPVYQKLSSSRFSIDINDYPKERFFKLSKNSQKVYSGEGLLQLAKRIVNLPRHKSPNLQCRLRWMHARKTSLWTLLS